MSRIDRYLLAQLLSVFAFFTLVLVAVYWVNRAAQLFDAVVGDGQSFWVFLELSALTLPNVFRIVMPLSAFSAAVYVAIRMTRDNELVVLQGTGLSFVRMLRPVALFGLIVALMLAVLMNVLNPMSRAQLAERQVALSSDIGARLLRAGEFLQPIDGVMVFIRGISQDGTLLDVFLSDARVPERRVEYNAASALLVTSSDSAGLVMRDGVALVFEEADIRLTTISFDELTFDIGALISPGTRRTDAREMPTSALIGTDPRDLTAMGLTLAELRFELVSRFAHPLSAVATSLIGFAALFLGQFSRLGAWRQVLGAIVLLALVQVTANVSAGIALRRADAAILAFAPVMAGMFMVVAMLAVAARRKGGR